MNKELKISTESARAAYNNTDANGRELLEHLFGKETFAQDIKDKVKTFDDAVAILGNDNQAVIDYYAIADKTFTEDILAFAKLRVIVEALNEGWKPKFTEDEWRYYPWFYLYTQDEIDNMDNDEKKRRNLKLRNIGEYAGFGFAYSDSAPSGTYLYVGYRLCFKNIELASYCGNQFIDIFMDFIS